MSDYIHLQHPRDDFQDVAACSPWKRGRCLKHVDGGDLTTDWDKVTCPECLACMGRRSTEMSVRQPDPRIKETDLGSLELDGKKYAIHNRPGCPRNACIEEFDGYLRCWACYTPLTDRAASFVRAYAVPTDSGTFLWNETVLQGFGIKVP